ncbi:hypothetical protein V5O48_019155, partial [Marasmius crinis-equi]
ALITIWCGLSITSGGIAVIMAVLATTAAAAIYHSSRESPLGLRSPVVARDRAYDAGPLKGRMLAPTRSYLNVLYLIAMVIVLGLAGSGLAILHALVSYEEKLQGFAGLTASFSTISWVWASVLLSYHRRPSIRRTLTRASTHFYTLIVLAVLNFVCGILILAHTVPEEDGQCDGVEFGNCWAHIVNGVLSLVLVIALIASAVYVYIRTVRGGGKLSNSNVARFDGEGPDTANREEILKLDP